MSDVSIGSRAAIGIRRSTMAIRVGLMGLVALLLFTVGEWPWAPVWWAAYTGFQLAILTVDRRMGGRGFWLIHGLYFLSFSVAGLPTWHLWTKVPYAGNAAATLFLCGMVAQLAASSLAARSLFICSVTPLLAYLLIVPPLAIGAEHGPYAVAIVACGLIFATYLGVVWWGQQQVLAAFAKSRADAQAANRAKSAFLASMSHEIRTPMNAVLGATNLLARTELSEEQREHVAMLQDGGAVLMQVLNDILDLSKIEAGKMTIHANPVDLQLFINRICDFWRPTAADAGLSLAVEAHPDLPRHVRLDSVRAGQVLFNLFSNAIKFTERGGVRMEVAPAAAADGLRLVFRVSDTGIGMSPEVMSRLFAPFEQADDSISRRFGGTGLGLAISHKLAGLLGGTLEVESKEGAGTLFTLSLPVTAAEPVQVAAAEAEPEPAPQPARQLRVLLAEDNPANQRVIELFLRPVSVDLTIVGDGAQALETLATQPFDVVLMDVQMPVMDGLEATRRIRASGGVNAEVPIIALTANVLENQRQACEAAGMSGHIGKPIDARHLLSSVVQFGRVHQARRDAAKAEARGVA